MIVDAHAHICVRELSHLVPEMPSIQHDFVDPDAIRAEMARRGVEGVVLSPWIGLFQHATPDLCRAHNDALAELVGGTTWGVGLVPMQDVAAAVPELERAMKLGLKGVEIPCRVDGVYLGDAHLEPFWRAAEAYGAVVFVHPTGMPDLRAHYMSNVVGNPLETAITAAHMVLSGTMEAHPGLRVLLSHGGGALSELRGRLDHGARVRPEIDLPRPPSEYVRRFYVDTITHDGQLLRELVAFAGADHVLLGSDFPFDMGSEDPIGDVRRAGLRSEDEALVLGGSARQLFSLGG